MQGKAENVPGNGYEVPQQLPTGKWVVLKYGIMQRFSRKGHEDVGLATLTRQSQTQWRRVTKGTTGALPHV